MELKLFRKNYKLSQNDLAELFGCSVGHISNIESGNRTLTALQIRLLIEKFGYDVVAKYAESGEMPQGAINIDMHKTEIKDNQGPVQAGNGNNMSPDAGLISVMQSQAAHITELLKQQDRLIKLLEERK